MNNTHPKQQLILHFHLFIQLFLNIHLIVYFVYLNNYYLICLFVFIHCFILSIVVFGLLEHIELPAKLLDYFLRSNKSNINQYCRHTASTPMTSGMHVHGVW